mmetsp:Transcript_2694/g.6705  ORF Transcript_2694/g.6705 Transcript_2694/m.6705 type:complete len:264 (+) Transcript_2694:695-1486(+)
MAPSACPDTSLLSRPCRRRMACRSASSPALPASALLDALLQTANSAEQAISATRSWSSASGERSSAWSTGTAPSRPAAALLATLPSQSAHSAPLLSAAASLSATTMGTRSSSTRSPTRPSRPASERLPVWRAHMLISAWEAWPAVSGDSLPWRFSTSCRSASSPASPAAVFASFSVPTTAAMAADMEAERVAESSPWRWSASLRSARRPSRNASARFAGCASHSAQMAPAQRSATLTSLPSAISAACSSVSAPAAPAASLAGP